MTDALREPTRIYAMRHGRTAWNVEQRIQGHTDEPLDATGLWQAGRLAQALEGEAIAAVYSSDLQRALATARPLAAACGAPLVADTGLRERAFGTFEGITHAEIEARWPEEAARWRRRDTDFGPGGGETLADFYTRCVGAVARLAQPHAGNLIAVVAHGGVLDCLYRAAAGVALDARRNWPLGNASVNRLLFNGESFTLLNWDDRAHLDEAPGAEQPY